jgi:hypothetical protein
MNSKAFLDLIQKHPLPWKLVTDMGGECAYASRDEVHVALGYDTPETTSLADAAPAMAAAILRYLEAIDTAYLDFDHAAESKEHRDALNALIEALPEALRP